MILELGALGECLLSSCSSVDVVTYHDFLDVVLPLPKVWRSQTPVERVKQNEVKPLDLDGWYVEDKPILERVALKLIYGNWNHLFTCGLVVLSLNDAFFTARVYKPSCCTRPMRSQGTPTELANSPSRAFVQVLMKADINTPCEFVQKHVQKPVNWLGSMWQDVVFLTWNMLVYMKSRWWAITILLKLEVFSS